MFEDDPVYAATFGALYAAHQIKYCSKPSEKAIDTYSEMAKEAVRAESRRRKKQEEETERYRQAHGE